MNLLFLALGSGLFLFDVARLNMTGVALVGTVLIGFAMVRMWKKGKANG